MRPRPDRWQRRRWLRPLASLYGRVIAARNARFDRGRSVTRVDVPVISVGNLTTGGTGKTPLVIHLAKSLRALGRRPAILTRGYKAKASQTADEVLEFQAALPDVPVIVNPKRVDGARHALSDSAGDASVDVLILDDGFQHRYLGRDLDIVLIDALDPWGLCQTAEEARLLPAGNLREPLDALARAGLLVISRANQVSAETLAALRATLGTAAPGCPMVETHIHAVGLQSTSHAFTRLEDLKPLRLQPVCGIGNPMTFVALLDPLAAVVRTALRFEDHHDYTARDVDMILTACADRGIDAVATTRKDWGKLAPLWPSDTPHALICVEAEVAPADPQAVLSDLLDQIIHEANDRPKAGAAADRVSQRGGTV